MCRARDMVLHYGDMMDGSSLTRLVSEVKPDEVYNLAAQSHVKISFELSEMTANVDGLGALRILDAIRTAGLSETCRFYQASTSELFGKIQELQQRETTPFYPRSPYGMPLFKPLPLFPALPPPASSPSSFFFLSSSPLSAPIRSC